MRTDLMTKNRSPREVGDTDAYNELQVRRISQARGDPDAMATLGAVKRRLRVLVVDDYRAAADTLAMLVRAWGHDVRQAYAGAAGLAAAAEYLPDILLLDIIMPKLSGAELALRVREEARLQDCLLIAISGCTDERQRLHCLEAGVDLFLIKPVNPHTLQSLLMTESYRVMRSRRHAASVVVTATPAEQWTGEMSCGPARFARNTAPTAVAT
jgi:DNA-binding response OmpR family regulator